jgi:EamA domain-containing membrane protein RarD
MWSCALQVGSLWTAFMLPSAWCAWARGAKDVTYNEMDKMWFESLLCHLQTIYHLTIDWKMVMNEAMKLMGSLSAQNLCTDCPFHTFFWAGPLFLETFPTFLLFLHRFLYLRTEICVCGERSHTYFLWTDVVVSSEVRARSWRFKFNWCEASH